MTDAQLATLSRDGSREAFAQLAHRWERRLFGFLRRLLGDEDSARETCQEALLKAYRNIGRLRQPEHFKAWIHQIAVNLCRDRGRSAGEHALVALDQVAEDSPPGALVSAQPSPLDEAERSNLNAILQQVLNRLPVEHTTT